MEISNNLFKVSTLAIGVILSLLFSFSVFSVSESYKEIKNDNKKFAEGQIDLQRRVTLIENTSFTGKDANNLTVDLKNSVETGFLQIRNNLENIVNNVQSIQRQVVEVRGQFDNLKVQLNQLTNTAELYRQIHDKRLTAIEIEYKTDSKMILKDLAKHQAKLEQLGVRDFEQRFIEPFDRMSSSIGNVLKTPSPIK